MFGKKNLHGTFQKIEALIFQLEISARGIPLGCVKFPKSFRYFTASGFSAGVYVKDHWDIFIFPQKWVLRVPQGGLIL